VPSLLSVTDPIVPVPEALVTTTVAPPTDKLLPYWSFAWTVNVTVEDPSAVTDDAEALKVDCAASAVLAVPVAVKVTGEPVSDPDVTVSVFDPAVVPSVHAGEVAMPELFVVAEPDDAKDPPPEATANVTAVP